MVNLNGESFINKDARLKAVAILLDKDGKPVNCNKSASIPYSQSGISADASDIPVSILYYDIAGLRVMNPQKGVFIRVQQMTDGSVRIDKVIL